MQPTQLNRKIGQVYLSLVPILTALFGFGVGHISYKIYLPVWIINMCLMIAAAWVLGLQVIKTNDVEKKQLALAAFSLVLPWIFISVFFGLGPPPDTAAQWVATATEQQLRYSILAVAGLFVVFGFAAIKEKLSKSGEGFYSLLGLVSIIIATPLFIINMIYSGSFLTELFRIMTAAGSEKLPEWFGPLNKQFGLISAVEVALTYLATAAFAKSFQMTGWFGKIASRFYITISLFALVIVILSVYCPQPFATAGFAVSIPAIPLIMPYFMGINLLRRTGNESSQPKK